jgi:sec-independent protein translocase protein TatB
VFGVSFSEVVMIAVVALVVVGPRRLPEILGTLGRWVGKFRDMTSEVRRQTGIDEILRQEGISGGIGELRSMLRGDLAAIQNLGQVGRFDARVVKPEAIVDAYGEPVLFDRLREYPTEGPDAYGAIPEDLLEPDPVPAPKIGEGTTATPEPKIGGAPVAPTSSTKIAPDEPR